MSIKFQQRIITIQLHDVQVQNNNTNEINPIKSAIVNAIAFRNTNR